MLKHEVQASSGRIVIPAHPIKALRPPTGADWVHEIKHDGYRMIVRRDGPTVRLYTRSAYEWTVRLSPRGNHYSQNETRSAPKLPIDYHNFTNR
jgi:ATP-dependent DNA ligase